MVLLVSDILQDAMRLINVVAADETPDTSDYTLALRTLNVMIDRWSTQRLLLRSTSPLTFLCVPGQASYTIAPSGANITSPKPIKLQSAYYTDTNNNDQAVDIITVENYNNLNDKDISTGPVMYVAYDAGAAQQTVSTGTIYVYPAPDQAYTIHIESDLYLTEFTTISDTVTFEPAYYEALIYNLAVRLFRYYRDANVQVPVDIALIAAESLKNLKTMNSVTVIAGMDLPGKVSNYNIYSDAAN